MAQNQKAAESALEIDRLATQLAKDPQSKVFMPLAEEYGKVGMWEEAAAVLEDGLKFYPGFITAMVALGRAYDQMGQATKAKAILEESVKLSPENLRAHRTLIKIYASQGENNSALQSCAVILFVNPRDEEALSIQAALGVPSKQTPQLPKPADSVTRDLSAQQPASAHAPAPLQASTQETTTKSEEVPVLTLSQPAIRPSDPLIAAAELRETALQVHGRTGEQPPVPEPDSQSSATVMVPPPSPQAGVVAQLEAWLRTIESRRRDRDSTKHTSHAKTS